MTHSWWIKNENYIDTFAHQCSDVDNEINDTIEAFERRHVPPELVEFIEQECKI